MLAQRLALALLRQHTVVGTQTVKRRERSVAFLEIISHQMGVGGQHLVIPPAPDACERLQVCSLG